MGFCNIWRPSADVAKSALGIEDENRPWGLGTKKRKTTGIRSFSF
jgi:hypothetical protein